MPDTNILQFPGRILPEQGADGGEVLLAKIATALRAMKELHAELESLKSMLKAENGTLASE